MIIIINAVRGQLDSEGRKSEVAAAFWEYERRKCRCIGAHKHGGKAMPKNLKGKGFGVQTGGSIGDVKET
jgi:hypothetical protein